ncbi:uncharacterized protein LOC141536226 isoform X2 [Cotesia typhae]|uniref:uncharacterized protein LOC141536226 isoform X2 n=1 Tax=Cotesia typhae TaxID=2053667 RepID=UPI003D68E0A7
MKYKVVFFVFLKVTLCCTMSSASRDISRPKNSEFIKHRLIEGRKIGYDQNISLSFRNKNSRLRSAIKIGKICLEDHDCKWNDNNELICVFQNMNKKIGKCGCPERSNFNRNTLSCTIQRYKRNYPGCTDCYNDNEFFLNGKCVAGIGAKCPEGTECRAKNSICEGGTCQCLSGYQNVNQSYCELNQCKENYDVCDPDLSIPCCDNQMRCINVNPELQSPHYICVKQNSLGESCDSNLDCMWISYAKCAEDGMCVCKNHALKYDNICLDKFYSNALDFRYESLFKKNVVTNIYSRMDDRIPPTGSSKSSNTIYGEWCISDDDCSYEDYRDLVCYKFSKDIAKNYCSCPNGTNYDFVEKRCTPEKHSELMNIRKEKYYESTHIKVGGEWYSVYSGNCSEDIHCEKLTNGVCKNNQCICRNGWRVVNRTFCEFPLKRCDLHKMSCTRKEDCFVKNSVCNNSFCDCGEEDYYKNGQCLSRKNGVGSPCICEQICTGLKYGVCRNDTCECQKNYEVKNGRCAGKHGQACDFSDDCFANNAMCRNKTCDCKDSFFPLGDGCVKGTINLDSKCSVEETCKAIRNSECKDGKCQCLANYKKRDGKCLGLDQAPCKISEDCFAENATCTNKKCVCSDGFYYENDHCYEKAKAVDDACHSQEACKKIKNTECKNGKCQCLPNYKKRNGNCLGLEKAPCETSKDCFSKNATCKSKKVRVSGSIPS